ncbi:hypothetical protein [Enterococcus sp. AZ163]|uniref:hypothetical protein n=1 Tax=Enterococcus sp. AZ163 TaxID=2774638 RepID=UPI003D29976F
MNINKLNKILTDMGLFLDFSDIQLDIPLAFKAKYELSKGILMEPQLSFLLIKEKRSGSIEAFIKQAEVMGKIAELPYVLVFSKISKETKKLLLKARIPFMDYIGNLFLPQLGAVLTTELPVFKDQKLSPSEQSVFIYLLLKETATIIPAQISEKLHLSIATVYRVLKSFTNREWLRSKHGLYQFNQGLKDIFQESLDLLNNPVKKCVFINRNYFNQLMDNRMFKQELNLAGLAALSKLSMLDDSPPAFAISKRTYQQIMKGDPSGKQFILDKKVKNDIELQLWEYAPLSIVDSLVDPISLLLSLKDNDDPRVEIELENLESKIIKKLEEKDAD